MSFEAELKKFELSSVFTINFSWLKRYVESDNGMYTPMKNISDDEFREIENSLYALQATWKAWREAKAQAVPEGFVLVPRECPDPIFADKLFDHLCEKAHGEFGDDQMIFFSDIDENAIWQLMIEAQDPAND